MSRDRRRLSRNSRSALARSPRSAANMARSCSAHVTPWSNPSSPNIRAASLYKAAASSYRPWPRATLPRQRLEVAILGRSPVRSDSARAVVNARSASSRSPRTLATKPSDTRALSRVAGEMAVWSAADSKPSSVALPSPKWTRVFEVSGGTTVGQSRSEIAVFLTDPRVGSGFRRAGAGNLDGPRAVGVVHGMAGPYRDRVVVPLELLDREFPDALKHAEPRNPVRPGGAADQVLVQQRAETAQDVGIRCGADLLGGGERPAASKDRQPPEERSLPVREEIVTPLDGRTQRPVPGGHVFIALAEQDHAIFQTVHQLFGAEDI